MISFELNPFNDLILVEYYDLSMQKNHLILSMIHESAIILINILHISTFELIDIACRCKYR